MAHTPNELIDLFPDKADVIHKLKSKPGEFSGLFDLYHEITREIHRAETDIEPMGDLHLEELRKQRLRLLDRISPMLKAN